MVILLDLDPLDNVVPPIVSEADVQTIFANVRGVRVVNRQLLQALERRVANWAAEPRGLGSDFQTFVPFLQLYVDYCSGHHTAIDLVNRLRERY